VRRRARLGLDDLDLDRALLAAEHAERVAVVDRVEDDLVQVGDRLGVALDDPVGDDEVGRGGAIVDPQARKPPLELGQRAHVAPPARLGQLHELAVA
jgi:hypothetical protein